MAKALTTAEFIQKAIKKHGNKYEYSFVEYKNQRSQITIVCSKHGPFNQLPNNHLNGAGCYKCGREYCSKITRKSQADFIAQAKKIHGDKYDYSLVNYINNRTKITIVCKQHGKFEQKPNNHIILGTDCPKCSGRYTSATNEWIERAKQVHGNTYDYSLVNYINSETKIDIICKKHGIFKQQPFSHLQNHGCPICKQSKGEKIIKQWLDERNIICEQQKTFPNCRGKNRCFPFDFYIPSLNTVIEFHGIQHYSAEKWGGKKGLTLRKRNDKIKRKYCKSNGINYIVIKYNQNIENCLDKFFKK